MKDPEVEQELNEEIRRREELRVLAREVRLAQTAYFRLRTPEALQRSKRAESALDRVLFGKPLTFKMMEEIER